MTAALQQFRAADPIGGFGKDRARLRSTIQPTSPSAGSDGQRVAVLWAEAALSVWQHVERFSAPRVALPWLATLYSQVGRGDAEGAVDTIFSNLDDLLLEGDFESCDSALRTIDLGRLDTYSIVAVLSVTLPAADKLTARTAFLANARHRLETLAPDRIEGLLSGLG